MWDMRCKLANKKAQGLKIVLRAPEKNTVNLKLRCDFDFSHLHEVDELAGCRHGHGLDVGGDVAQDGQQAVEEGLQPMVSARDNLLKGRQTLIYS